ncbi:hypothetical protein CBR_g51525 [Chara braunii]|uniref:GS catalytic domain-containing protein n=1 Tax=Chara braunii TaxID=69332 RepID=A0A388M8P2_CHABU|nr:hypothetical protein CBR_g51525 [Chara braunii]|eukprot:GBG90920.1 hypothetical protein CBR_g51525 [Chara braunii]
MISKGPRGDHFVVEVDIGGRKVGAFADIGSTRNFISLACVDRLRLGDQVQRLSRSVASTLANKHSMVVQDYVKDVFCTFSYGRGELRHKISFLVSYELPFNMLLDMYYLEVAQPQFDWDRKVMIHKLPNGRTIRLQKFKASSLVENYDSMCASSFCNYYKQNREEGMYLVFVSKKGEAVKSPPEIEAVVAQYSDLFEGPNGVVEREVVHAIEVVPGSKVPKGQIYRMSPAELDELRRQLKELTKKGWIRPSTSPYGAPVLFVPEKGGKRRMCIDYRGLNAITVKNAEPLPCIDDLLDRVQGCQCFTKIDLKSGYHQIAIRPEDQHKTAFQTSSGGDNDDDDVNDDFNDEDEDDDNGDMNRWNLKTGYGDNDGDNESLASLESPQNGNRNYDDDDEEEDDGDIGGMNSWTLKIGDHGDNEGDNESLTALESPQNGDRDDDDDDDDDDDEDGDNGDMSHWNQNTGDKEREDHNTDLGGTVHWDKKKESEDRERGFKDSGYMKCSEHEGKEKSVEKARSRRGRRWDWRIPWYFKDACGSGNHVHCSIWESGQNVFGGSLDDPSTKWGISKRGQQFVAGILHHLAGLMAVIAPSPNSFERLIPGNFSCAFHCWGIEHRDATLRVVSPFSSGPAIANNFELRAIDGCSNPYLALAVMVAAGMDGLRQGMTLPEPAGKFGMCKDLWMPFSVCLFCDGEKPIAATLPCNACSAYSVMHSECTLQIE